MSKPHKGIFIPKNPQKYIHSNINKITYRSSWELQMMQVLDQHPSIIKWASEPVKIPYYNPFYKAGGQIGRQTYYIPDFYVAYEDRSKTMHQELIEIKPSKEDPRYGPKVGISKLTEAKQALNMLKWKAATAYCAARNWKFRVMTEMELFGYKRKTGI